MSEWVAAALLSANKALRTLGVGDNIGRRGLAVAAGTLKRNQRLEEVSVAWMWDGGKRMPELVCRVHDDDRADLSRWYNHAFRWSANHSHLALVEHL